MGDNFSKIMRQALSWRRFTQRFGTEPEQGAIALASVRRESGGCVDSIKAARRRVGSTAPRLTTETDRSGLNG
jgi:hypothetical protein